MFSRGLTTFLPSYLPGIKLWLEADNVLNGSNPADSALVDTVVDLSGKTGNATAAGGLRPTFLTNQQNGLPGLQFSGAQSLSVANLALGSNVSVFAVSQSANESFFMESGPNINTNDGIHLAGGFGTNALRIRNDGSVVMNAGTNWAGTDTVLMEMTYDGSTLLGYKNGVQTLSTSGSIPNNTVTDTLYIGSRAGTSVFMTGFVFLIVICEGVLSSGYQALMRQYANQKWAIY